MEQDNTEAAMTAKGRTRMNRWRAGCCNVATTRTSTLQDSRAQLEVTVKESMEDNEER